MKTLLEIVPNAIEESVVRQIGDLHKDCLVSFLMPQPHHEGKYCSIGTGFLIFSPDPTLAIVTTARHVLEEFNFDHGRITIGTRLLSIGNVGLRLLDPKVDLAQWEIPSNVLFKHGLTGLQVLPVLAPEQHPSNFEPMDSFVLLGYPGSKNAKLDFRNGRSPERHILGLALHQSVLSTVSNAREFQYNGKGIPEAWRSEVTTPPPLDGMSGCPCLRLVYDHTKKTITAILAGVFSSWQRQAHKLSVVPFGDPWRA